MRDLPPAARLPLLFFGMISLLAGVTAGLARLGWAVPPLAASAAGWHGALMIPAFFGTVIGLERAVAIGKPNLVPPDGIEPPTDDYKSHSQSI